MEKKRLNVNIEDKTAEQLKRLAEAGINHTEAVRRAVAMFCYVMDQQEEGNKLAVRNAAGQTIREVRIL